MPIALNDNLNVLGAIPVDARFGPYPSLADAKAALSLYKRYVGLTIGIQDAGEIVEYWFKSGITDTDLEVKIPASTIGSDKRVLLNSDTNLEINTYYLVDSSTQTLALTLPSNSSVGDFVWVQDAKGTWNTNNVTVNRNGEKILGLEDSLSLDVNDAAVLITYVGGSVGWDVKELTGDYIAVDAYVGATGASGTAGKEIVLGSSGNYLQWQYQGASEWNNLIAIDNLAAGTGNNLIFDESVEGVSTLIKYKSTLGVETPVRSVTTTGNTFILNLATFTPTLTITGQTNLDWDVAATQFTVSVNNPADVPSKYVNEVAELQQLTGSISALNSFNAGTKSATPAGGIAWTQVFSADGDSYIKSTSNTIAGGNASARISFNYYNGTSTELWSATADFTTSWKTPTNSLSIAALSGKTFLKNYASTTYTCGYTGVSAESKVHAVTPALNSGTVTSATGSGTYNFATAITHKNISGRSLSLSTTFTRPSGVAVTSYSITLTTSANVSANFTYPSFWLWTANTATVPTNSSIVDNNTDSGLKASVNELGDESKTLTLRAINNTSGGPQAFWFCVRETAAQPTTFKVGSSSFQSDTSYVSQDLVVGSGDYAETYKIYGITLQNGVTYVSIS